MRKLELKHRIPNCCKKKMNWKGTFRIGTYTGGISIYECATCDRIKEVTIEPTKHARKIYKKFFNDIKNCRSEQWKDG